MINRKNDLSAIQELLRSFPVVGIIGARQVGKSAAALLLESRIGEQFDAIVTGASPKGAWARLLKMPVEGRLVHGFEGVDVGNRIRVQLVFIDVERGYRFQESPPFRWPRVRRGWKARASGILLKIVRHFIDSVRDIDSLSRVR